MPEPTQESELSHGNLRKAKLYRVPIDRVTLGDILDFLKEFSIYGDSLQKDMIQINFNIK